VPLGTVARIERTVGPLSVNHLGQMPAVTLSFNLAPGKALGDAGERGERRRPAETLPVTHHGQPPGTAQAFASSMTGMGILILVPSW
jgi:HAE1 family hydrophobic/amphiphilic exporter-1